MKIYRTTSLVWTFLWLAACSLSVDVSEPTPTPLPPTPTSPPASPPVDVTSAEVTPEVTAVSPTPDVPWAGRGLTGGLLVMLNPQGPVFLVEVDLETGEQRTIYTFPEGSIVTAAEMSPDGEQILLAYVPPAEDPAATSYLGLYLLPADGSGDPVAVLDQAELQHSLFHPSWSPDGNYIYYSRFIVSGVESKINVERIAYPDGEPELLVEDAYWQKLSPDGARMVYVTSGIGAGSSTNELYVADADGGNATRVIQGEGFTIVDAPVFSPDGEQILFSVPESEAPPSPLSWLDRLMGVRVARAHDVPSDWWIVSLADGQPRRLTSLLTTSLYGDFSPDGRHIASIFVVGLFVMNADGTDLQFIGLDSLPFGTLDWVP